MSSENLTNSQPTADVRLDAACEDVANLPPLCFGASRPTRLPWVFAPEPSTIEVFRPFDEEAARNKDISLAVNLLRAMPTSWISTTPLNEIQKPRTLKWTPRTRLKCSGFCRWCEVSVRSSATKPRKDCSRACTKQWERHGCTKAVWTAFKEIRREMIHPIGHCDGKLALARALKLKNENDGWFAGGTPPPRKPASLPEPTISAGPIVPGDAPVRAMKARTLRTLRLSLKYRARVRAEWELKKALGYVPLVGPLAALFGPAVLARNAAA